MRQGHTENHWNDADGNPAGGCTFGVGFAIAWQNGPLGRHGSLCASGVCVRERGDGEARGFVPCTRRPPNGAFVEDVIQAAIGRIEFYQASRFASADNAEALEHLRAAAEALDRRTRTRSREQRGVEGTHAT